MENNNMNYIPYGAAALGAVLGNVLYKKYPKFGTAGRLLAIGIGAVSGYYISDKIIGGDDSDDFRNAAGGGCKQKRCDDDCQPFFGDCRKDGKCYCYTDRTLGNRLTSGNSLSQMTAVRNFSNFANAYGDGMRRRDRRRCNRHDDFELNCTGLLTWDSATCRCKEIGK